MTNGRPLFRRLAALALLVIATSAAAAAGPGSSPTDDYVWQPSVAPSGPLVIVVNLPTQQLHVYRNGVRIGASRISSGKPGHETPVGVFTILQKDADHRSNLYDDAPMPWMQRLTWDGVALHAGRLPGRPASHGCIRLPEAFARTLYAATRPGDVVLVSDDAHAPGVAVSDGVLRALGSGNAVARGETFWTPAIAEDGPITVVLSTASARIAVMRNGRRIGQAPIDVRSGLRVGTQAYVLLDGRADGMNPVLPDRPARRWLSIDLGHANADADLRQAIDTGDLRIPAAFAARVDDLLVPGATVVVTDEPLDDASPRERLELEDGDAH